MKRIGRSLAAAAAALGMGLGMPTPAGADAIAERLSLGGGVDVTTAYFFRGIMQERRGFIAQPSADLGLTLYRVDDYDLPRDGPIRSVALTLGTWNSVHSHDDTGTYFESDLYAGLRFGLFDHVEAAFSYVAYLSPTDAFDTIHEFDLSVTIDDSQWLGPLALSPSVTLAHEFDHTRLGAKEGTYLQLGVEPSFALTRGERYPVSLNLPVVAGFSLGDYYETIARNDETWGFASVGAVASVPLAFMGEQFGFWSASMGAHLYTFNANLEAINEDDDPWVVGMAGLQVAY